MEAYTTLLGMLLVIMAVLAGAILYLFVNQRNYQRVDYSALIDQEERERRYQANLRILEQMLSDLAGLEQRRRIELEHTLETANMQLERRIGEAQQNIVSRLFANPEQFDGLLCTNSGVFAESPRMAADHSEAANPQLLRFLRGARQRQIADMLEQGLGAHEIAHQLGLSRHEVELVSSIVFGSRVA